MHSGEDLNTLSYLSYLVISSFTVFPNYAQSPAAETSAPRPSLLRFQVVCPPHSAAARFSKQLQENEQLPPLSVS